MRIVWLFFLLNISRPALADPTNDHFFAPDQYAENNFSLMAHEVSYVTMVSTVVYSLVQKAAYISDDTISRGYGERSLFLESVSFASAMAVTYPVKHMVRRPRPYTRSNLEAAKEFQRSKGFEANLSFFSGHSSGTFAYATTASLLSGAPSKHNGLSWGVHYFFAGSTAWLRTTAGMHYYTDIVVGSLVGIGVGSAIASLHSEGRNAVAWREAGIGLVLGVGFAELTGSCEPSATACFTPIPNGLAFQTKF